MKNQSAYFDKVIQIFCLPFLLFWIVFFNAYAQKVSSSGDSITYFYNIENYQKGLELSESILARVVKDSSQNPLAYATALFHKGMFECRLQDWELGMKSVFAAEKRMTRAKMGDPLLRAQVALYCFIGCSNLPDSANQAPRWITELQHIRSKALSDSNLVGAYWYYAQALQLFFKPQFEASHLFFDKAIAQFEKGGYTIERDYMKCQYFKSESLFNVGRMGEAMDIWELLKTKYESAGTGHIRPLAEIYAKLYEYEFQAGNLSNMEKYANLALQLNKEVYGVDNPRYLQSMLNLSMAWHQLMEYEKAEKLVRNTLELLKNKGLEFTIQYHLIECLLASVIIAEKKFTESEKLFNHAFDYFKVNNFDPPYEVQLNRAYLHLKMGNFARALYFYDKGTAKAGPVPDPFLNSAKGALLRMTGQFAEAEKCLKATLERPGAKTFHFGTKTLWFENQFGRCFLDQGKLPQAEAWFESVNEKMLQFIRLNFPRFSDYEKERFQKMIAFNIDYFNTFCQLRAASNPKILDQFYNNQLATKALLLNSSAKWKQRIKSSHDRKLLAKFGLWEEYRNRLSQLYLSGDSLLRMGIDSIEQHCHNLEKDLSQRSEHFAELADKKIYTWKDVQAALKPDEVAVEMVRLSKYGVAKRITDTSDPAKPVYPDLDLTDTIYYAALLVKPGFQHPEMILLRNGNELEGKYLNRYKQLIKNKQMDAESYGQFWKKLSERLKNSKTVYFSADGVYHQLNLNTLYNPATKKYLLDEQDIRLVTVTKDILLPRKTETENKLAYLYGRPSYYNTYNTMAMVSGMDRKSPVLRYSLSMDGADSLEDLPGTGKEVYKISSTLKASGWEVQYFTEGNASEESLKESYKPRLLHIATHGFFQTDSLKNPLLRSGLMLAGAGKTLSGYQEKDGEDGILTAYEAMNLNLDNTDLVVLSACETGLGEIKNGEGVYGLQRAFKVAGAKSIIMSLWKVDDEATQELMVSFYKHWLGGGRKRASFLKAQKELKVKYPNPYFWGAFVMVGE